MVLDAMKLIEELSMRDPRGYYSLKQVMKLTGLSRGTIERLVDAGRFPEKVTLSPLRRGYKIGEVNLYLRDPSGYSQPDGSDPRSADD